MKQQQYTLVTDSASFFKKAVESTHEVRILCFLLRAADDEAGRPSMTHEEGTDRKLLVDVRQEFARWKMMSKPKHPLANHQ